MWNVATTPIFSEMFQVHGAGSQKQLALRLVLYMLVIHCCVQKIRIYTTLHLSDITSQIRSVTACEIHANGKKKEFVVRLLNDHLHRFTGHECQTEKYWGKSHCLHIICSFIPADRNKLWSTYIQNYFCQQMHCLLKHKMLQFVLKISLYMAPTCFGLSWTIIREHTMEPC